MKRKIAILIVALILTVSLAAFAATSTTNGTVASNANSQTLNLARGYGAQFMASIVSKLTGLSVDDVVKLRSQGQTFYQIALSKGVTAEKFKSAVYQEKASLVDQKAKDGVISKEQADAIKAQMKSRIDSCNGQGYQGRSQTGYGIFGNGAGQTQNSKQGLGYGRGFGQSRGQRGFGSGNSLSQTK